MRKLAFASALVAPLLASCPRPNAPSARVEIRTLGGNSAQLVPAEGQLAYCLVFTFAASGTIRQLTMSPDDKSVSCPAHEPIGGVRYRFPISEGRVRIMVLFSDRRLDAGSLAEELLQVGPQTTITATDFRLPGRVNVEVLDFAPTVEKEPAVGELIKGKGEPRSPDAGR